MRTPLTTAELERYISNDRVTISVKRTDLQEVLEQIDMVADSIDDDDAYEDERYEPFIRFIEVASVALKSQ